ncbi:Double-stranded RNA-binding protein 4-like protein [Drosera capensis]
MAGEEESRDSDLRQQVQIQEEDRNRGEQLQIEVEQQQQQIQEQQQICLVSPEPFPPKSQLTTYIGRAHLQPPVYHTINEGLASPPSKFKCTVLVDGVAYESPNTFSTIKEAEQDAAKYALEGIAMKLKEEGRCFVSEDKFFCKSILNEFAMKMNMKLPVYTTKMSEGYIPSFTASLVFNDHEYTGEVGRNKKEAEQLAARATILSILDGSEMALSEVIKSKAKLQSLMQKSNDLHPICDIVPMVSNISNEIGNPGVVETEVTGHNRAQKAPGNAIMEATGVEISITGMNTDELRSGTGEPPSHEMGQPDISVPAIQTQPSVEERSVKKRRKNKKKSNKRARINALAAMNQNSPSVVAPQNQDVPCAPPPQNQDSGCRPIAQVGSLGFWKQCVKP